MSLAPGLHEALAAATGEDGLESHAPRAVDGVEVATTLRPADGEALARVLGLLSEAGLGAVILGGGSRLGLGNPPRRADVLLSTERLAGIDTFEPGEGVCHAGAGTRLADLHATVEAEGWELPLDPPGEASTVGGVIAAAAVGPRALGHGPARDAVLGLEVALSSGERTRCGGRVVKNVTGYDLAKLYTGSLGSLGVVEGAWLRLRPAPECARVLAMTPPASDACRVGLAASRRSTARAAALAASAGTIRLVVELAGDAAAVERDAAELRAEGAEGGDEWSLDEMRSLQQRLPAGGGLRFRLTVLPSRLDAAFVRLLGGGAELLAHPGQTLLRAGFALEEGDRAGAERAFALVAETAAEAGGSCVVLEEGPPWAKRGRDVFGPEDDTLPLARALKDRFDPTGTLNPGRFQGFL